MKLLQISCNAGPCPFLWQELRVFLDVNMAVSCHVDGRGLWQDPMGWAPWTQIEKGRMARHPALP